MIWREKMALRNRRIKYSYDPSWSDNLPMSSLAFTLYSLQTFRPEGTNDRCLCVLMKHNLTLYEVSTFHNRKLSWRCLVFFVKPCYLSVNSLDLLVSSENVFLIGIFFSFFFCYKNIFQCLFFLNFHSFYGLIF